MPKIAFQRSDVITFTCLTIAQPKMYILLWNLVFVLFTCSFTTCIPFFWITPKIWILLAFIFEKSKFWFFWDQNWKISKIRYSHFVVCLILRVLAFTDCVLLQTCTHSRSLQTFAAFWPNIAEHDVTKTQFKKKSRQIFLKFWCQTPTWCSRSTESFVSISAAVFELSRKSGRGGGEKLPTPHRGAG